MAGAHHLAPAEDLQRSQRGASTDACARTVTGRVSRLDGEAIWAGWSSKLAGMSILENRRRPQRSEPLESKPWEGTGPRHG